MDSKGNFITIKPKNDVVGRYIDYYYFHVSDDENFSKKFFFYPNYKHAITIYKGSDVSLTGDGSLVVPSIGNSISSFYSINTEKNFKVELHGIFNKIGVVFNPLGLNNFLKEPLGDFFDRSINILNCFGNDYMETLEQVYAEPDTEQRGKLLDSFFSNNFTGFNEPVVKRGVQEILNSNGSIKVEELSDLLGVNRKTLLRL